MAVAAIEQGSLVEDEAVLEAVLPELARAARGFVLDGFPRTLVQAMAFEHRHEIAVPPLHVAIDLEVPHDVLVDRLMNRRSHSSRRDDTVLIIEYRLSLHRDNVKELLDYYDQKGLLIKINGTGSVEAVEERILEQLEPLVPLPRWESEAASVAEHDQRSDDDSERSDGPASEERRSS
jgi:adenylate kinase